MTISRVGWVIGIVVTIVFAANACTLRKEISEITSNVKDNHNKDETVPNFTLPHYGVFTRICQSKIHGVGVFAIRDIPKYTYIFTGDNSKMVWVNKTVVDKQEPNIKKLYDDFCVIKGDKYYCPDNFNNMNIGWFLNESKENPNVGCDENYDFYALNDISKGEELTLSYTTFSDEPE
jgi:SET domain-containing protein